MNGLGDLARRLESTTDRVERAAVHAYGEVIGAEMVQDFEDHRDTGKLAETLRVDEVTGAVDFTSQDYRQYVRGSKFIRGVPRATLARAREAASAAVHEELAK